MKAILFAVLLGSALSAGTEEAIVAKIGDPAPTFEGTWLNHPPASLDDLAGRIVFIEAWRTW